MVKTSPRYDSDPLFENGGGVVEIEMRAVWLTEPAGILSCIFEDTLISEAMLGFIINSDLS